MKLVTYEGTELELSPVELSMLVELGLAKIDIDLTDVVSVDDENCEYEYSYCDEAEPEPEPIDRFADAKVEVVDRHGSLTLTIDGWCVVSIDKEKGTLIRHICADLSGIEADEQGRIIMDDEE